MAGIAGWANAAADGIPGDGLVTTPDVASTAAWPGGGPGVTRVPHSDDGLLVAVDGRIRWQDARLTAIAEAQGQAAALATAYRDHGHALVSRLGGHFAMAIVDTSAHRALIAVDRMATRPLCFAELSGGDGGGVVFASSATAVRRHPQVGAEFDRQAIYDYVYFHMIPSPATIFREIAKLEPATCALFENGRVTTQRYWTPEFSERNDASFEELEQSLKSTLRDAVLRCEPDEATASFLSGGLDSSCVCGVFAGLSERQVSAYTIGFAAEGYDEMHYARIAAEHFQLDLREHYVQPEDIADTMVEIAASYDEPFGNSSAVPALICARRAHADGTRALLAGDGGDELFAGNERYARQTIFEYYYRLPGWLRQRVVEPIAEHLNEDGFTPTSKLRSYVMQAREPMPGRLETYNFLHRISPDDMFEGDFLASIDTQHPLDGLQKTYDSGPGSSLVNRMLYLDWKVTLADNDLRKVGRMCELAGVEARYPMLDDQLIELSARVPPDLKLKNRNLRYFFKRALRDFLPAEIIDKPKQGFGLPFGVWLRTSQPLQDLVYSSLSALGKRGIVRSAFLEELIDTHRSGHAAYYGNLVWVLAMLELWLVEHGGPQNQPARDERSR